MTVSYHELTYGQPKNPKAERQQSLLLCTITLAFLFHSAISAGLFASLSFNESASFPGGEFVYKFMTNDYVAASGAVATISADLGIDESGLEKPRNTIDFLYTIYLDDAAEIHGGKTRFATGALVAGEKGVKSKLLEMNKSIPEVNEGKQSKDTRYEVANLPKVDAVSVDHPFTGGAWSALLMRYKIVPAFKKHAKASKSPILISTCSEKQAMCTFYMPLSKQDKFFVGKQTAEEYSQSFAADAGFLERMGVEINLGKMGGVDWEKVWKGIQKTVGLGNGNGKDEL